jgi:Nucleotide modification associated domain 3
MQVVLLRVGIDTGSGGIHGPLFEDGSFEFLCIPDKYNVEQRTYGSLTGKFGRRFIDYFPMRKQAKMENCPVHADPEFETFTYGDSTSPKAGLRRLQPGDILAFYCGLQGWGWQCDPALYLVGYFEVGTAGLATHFEESEVTRMFASNAHVRHREIYQEQRKRLVLVKGTTSSRFFSKAVQISEVGSDRNGSPIDVLSQKMRRIFGDFGGRVCIKRSPPRWVEAEFTEKAAEFLRQCE